MKAELKVKLLQHLNQKKQDEGFTLIEMLVVIIIIGILAAVALPSFLSQSAKSRQSEAKTNVGALNRAQQTYYFEKLTFTETISDLGLGISNTNSYSYSATAAGVGGITNGVVNKATSLKSDLKAYAGGVFKSTTDQTTQAILCEANAAREGDVANNPTNASTCGDNTTRMQ